MKKILTYSLVGLIVLFLVAAISAHLFLDSAVKKGVETVGPMLVKVPVKVGGVSISPLSGSGTIEGLVVSNPEGYKSESAIELDLARLSVQPSSVLGDKVIVRSVVVNAPVITFETDLKGNNLSQILKNLESVTGADDKPEQPAPEEATRKLQVDELVITGAKVNVAATALGGKGVTVAIPDIKFTDLGTGPEGITAAELTSKVLKELINSSISAGTQAIAGIGKDAINQAGKVGTDAVEKATRGLGGLLRPKQSATGQ